MRELIRDYRKLHPAILNLILAEFFLQLINSSFLAILPLYMRNEGYHDGEIANYTSYRYIGVLVLALSVGLYIKGRKVKPLFYISAFCVPLFGTLILIGVHLHDPWLNYSSQISWGATFTLMQIPVIPFILRNCEPEEHTGAISLSYATFALSSIAGSTLITLLNGKWPEIFSERVLLHGICGLGFLSFFFVARMRITERVPGMAKSRTNISDFDWGLITRALIPTLILAVGAGFTIPFISLFFEAVHGLKTSQFTLTNLIASILIATCAIYVPLIKKKLGYRIAIPTTQSFAILALVLMATTQLYAGDPSAVWIAIVCYTLRQPLMNMAGPMTTDVVMGYVGKRNQEMVSALTASIWSGAWYFSGKLFGNLRDMNIKYVYIFMITAALYSVGVVWYYFLVKQYEKKNGL
ncbi:MAG TPA: MFS transporter [Bacteroidia bacterium]|jgi:hypothetical protein